MACMNWNIKCVLLGACYGFKIWCIAVLPTPAQLRKLTLPVAVCSITCNKIPLTYDLKYYLLKIIKFTYPYHNLVTSSFHLPAGDPFYLSAHKQESGNWASVGKRLIWPCFVWSRSCSKAAGTSQGWETQTSFSQGNPVLALLCGTLEGPRCPASPLMCLICWSHL